MSDIDLMNRSLGAGPAAGAEPGCEVCGGHEDVRGVILGLLRGVLNATDTGSRVNADALWPPPGRRLCVTCRHYLERLDVFSLANRRIT